MVPWLFGAATWCTREDLFFGFIRFESVSVVMLSVNALLLLLHVDIARWRSWMAQAFTVVVTTVVNHLGHEFFPFRRPAMSTP